MSSDREIRFSLTARDDKKVESENPDIVTIMVKHVNRSPPASVDGNQTVSPGDVVTMDGSKSSDPDIEPLKYSWIQTAGPGPKVKVERANTHIASFTMPSNILSDTNLVFKLTVTDTNGATDTEDSRVVVSIFRYQINHLKLMRALIK